MQGKKRFTCVTVCHRDIFQVLSKRLAQIRRNRATGETEGNWGNIPGQLVIETN